MTFITTSGKKECMDLALTLFSYGIDCIPNFVERERKWGVIVCQTDERKSLHLLSLLKLEQKTELSNISDQSGLEGSISLKIFMNGIVLGWLAFLAFLFVVSPADDFQLNRLGILNTATINEAQYFRLITSICLHGDLQHLSLNLIFGFVFISLACWRHGTGIGLLFSLLSGIGANCVYCMYKFSSQHNWTSLGASGMIFGSLGLMASAKATNLGPNSKQLISLFRKHRSVIGVVSLFGLMGLNPASNWVAHLAGLLLGIVLSFFLEKSLARGNGYQNLVNIMSLIIFLIIVWASWALAVIYIS